MPYRIKIRTPTVPLWEADVDASGKVSAATGFPPVSLGNVGRSLELINSAINFVEQEGLISFEVEKV